jgi:hypothetical protein
MKSLKQNLRCFSTIPRCVGAVGASMGPNKRASSQTICRDGSCVQAASLRPSTGLATRSRADRHRPSLLCTDILFRRQTCSSAAAACAARASERRPPKAVDVSSHARLICRAARPHSAAPPVDPGRHPDRARQPRLAHGGDGVVACRGGRRGAAAHCPSVSPLMQAEQVMWALRRLPTPNDHVGIIDLQQYGLVAEAHGLVPTERVPANSLTHICLAPASNPTSNADCRYVFGSSEALLRHVNKAHHLDRTKAEEALSFFPHPDSGMAVCAPPARATAYRPAQQPEGTSPSRTLAIRSPDPALRHLHPRFSPYPAVASSTRRPSSALTTAAPC